MFVINETLHAVHCTYVLLHVIDYEALKNAYSIKNVRHPFLPEVNEGVTT